MLLSARTINNQQVVVRMDADASTSATSEDKFDDFYSAVGETLAHYPKLTSK